MVYLLTIKQKSTKIIKEYVACFNEEKLQVEGITDGVSLLAFMSYVKARNCYSPSEKRLIQNVESHPKIYEHGRIIQFKMGS